MNVTNKLAILLVLFLTLGISAVSAVHSATVTLDQDYVEASSTDTYTFTVEHSGSEGEGQIYRIDISAPTEFSNVQNVDCPQGWSKSEDSTSSEAVCITDADPSNSASLNATESADLSLEADSADPNEDTSYDWSVRTKDNSFDTNTNSVSVKVDVDAPESTAVITSPSEQITDSGSWTIEGQNIEDDSSGVESVDLEVKAPGDNSWSTFDSIDDPSTTEEFSKYSPGDDGSYEFRTVAYDALNNEESVSTYDDTITYDTKDPSSVSIDSPTSTQDRQSTESLSVDYSYTEANADYAELKLTYQGVTETYTDDDIANGTDNSETFQISSLPVEEGTYDLEVKVYDYAGNSDTVSESNAVLIDNTAPDFKSAITGDSKSGDSTALDKVTLSMEETGSGIDPETVTGNEFEVDGSDATGASVSGQTITLTLGSDLARGAEPEVELTGSISDNAGNALSSGKLTSSASDGLSPKDPVKTTASDITSSNQGSYSVDVDLESTHEEGSVFVRLDDGSDSVVEGENMSSSTDPVTISGIDASNLGEGSIDVEAKVMDGWNEGNTNPSGYTKTTSITKDTQGPQFSDESPTDYTNQAAPTMTVDITDSTTSVNSNMIEVSVGNSDDSGKYLSSVATGNDHVSFTSNKLTIDPDTGDSPLDLDNEEIHVDVSAADSVGNTNSFEWSFGFDTDKPDVSVSTPSDGAELQSLETISGRASDENGVSKVELEIQRSNDDYWDGDNWVGSSTKVTAEGTESWSYETGWEENEDTYTVKATATDAASNTKDSNTVSYTIDKTSPDVSSVTLTDEETDGDGGNEIVEEDETLKISAEVSESNTVSSVTADASDFGAGTVTLSGSSTYSTTFNVGSEGSFSDGSYDLTVKATDKADNTGSGTSNQVSIDTEPPTVSNVEINSQAISGTEYVKDTDEVKITAEVSDQNLGDGDTSSVTADLSDLGDGESVSADSYDGTEATWTVSNADTTPENGQVKVTVTATDPESKTSSASDTATADNTAPSTPTGVSANAMPGGDIKVSWDSVTDSESGLDKYVIYRADNSGGSFTQEATVQEGTTSYRDSSVTSSEDYFYKVAAKDKIGNKGSRSSQVSATADDTAPSVSNLKLENDGANNLDITFDTNEAIGDQENDLTVTVDSPGTTDIYSFDRSDFTESGTGPYTYSLSAGQAFDDGEGSYTATIDTIEDTVGNSKSDGSDSHSYNIAELQHSEIDNAASDSSKSVVDLTFDKTTTAIKDSTATLKNAPGVLKFTSGQEGKTLQSTYYEDTDGDSTREEAVLETGDQPAVESIGLVGEFDRFTGAGADLSTYQELSRATCTNTVSSDIQSAIDSASQDEVICLDGSSYSETLTFSGDESSGITIQSADSSTRPTIDGGINFKGAVTGLTVQDVELTGSTSGRTVNLGRPVTDLAFHDVLFDGQDAVSSAIYVHKSGEGGSFDGYFEITGSEITGYADGSPMVGTSSVNWEFDSIEFVGNHIHDNAGSVKLKAEGSPGKVVAKNNLFENTAQGDWGWAALEVNSASEAVVEHNTMKNNGGKALQLTDAGTVDVSFNVMENNDKGIHVKTGDASTVTVQLNDIDGNSNYALKNEGSNQLDAGGNWFGTDGIQSTGSVDASYTQLNTAENSDGADIDTFRRTLSSGENLVSFPIVQGEKPVTDVTSGLEKVDTIWTYNDGQWKEVYTGDTSDNSFQGGRGYLFNMDSDLQGTETLSVNVDHEYQTVNGSDPTSFELSSGWTLAGTYEEHDPTEKDALSSLDGDFKACDSGLNGVSNMETGVGYWVTRTDDNGFSPTCS